MCVKKGVDVSHLKAVATSASLSAASSLGRLSSCRSACDMEPSRGHVIKTCHNKARMSLAALCSERGDHMHPEQGACRVEERMRGTTCRGAAWHCQIGCSPTVTWPL